MPHPSNPVAAYERASEQLADAFEALAAATLPLDRARYLATAGAALEAQARNHTAVYGPDPITEDGGRDRAKVLETGAVLYLLLADVELAHAYDRGRQYRSSPFETLIGEQLDQMAAPGVTLEQRMTRLLVLVERLEDTVGVAALDVLFNLPAPGLSGWMTTDAKARLIEASIRQQAQTRILERILAPLSVLVTLVCLVFGVWSLSRGDTWGVIAGGLGAFGVSIISLMHRHQRTTHTAALTDEDDDTSTV